MSNIDLSKAKVGDKFKTRAGYVVELKDTVLYLGSYVYRLTSPNAFVCVFQDGRMYKCNKASEFDLVEQVFDIGDLLDSNISVEERGQALVEMAKNEHEEAKEFGVVIQNLPYIVEQPKEDNPELQRRQDVVELAERIFFSDRGNMYTFKECVEIAENSVNIRNQYLKDGKL